MRKKMYIHLHFLKVNLKYQVSAFFFHETDLVLSVHF